MPTPDAPMQEETNLTEIELLPDGRIFLFGASREVLEVLDTVQAGRDPAVRMRLEQSTGLPRREPGMPKKADHPRN